MSLFKASRERSLATEITTARVRHGDLHRELAEAEAAVAAKQSALEDLHIQGANADAVAKANSALAAAERDVKGRIGAITKIEATINAKEVELAAYLDSQARKATVAELHVRERRFSAAHAGLIAALTEYAAASGDIAPVIPEAKQLQIFTSALAEIDLLPYATLVPTLIANHIVAVQNGAAPATLPDIETPAANPAAPMPPATTRIYTLKPVRWHDPANPAMTRFHPQYSDLDLPHAFAEQAIAASLAVPITDQRVGVLKRQHSPKHVHPEQCSWIGNADEPGDVQEAPQEPVLHSAFNGA